jgi:5'-3' exonuclease
MKVFKDSILIFAIDTPQNTIWRNNEICNYKGKRQDMTEKHNFKSVFKYTYNELIPKWINKNKNMFEIKIDEIEADDIIGLTTIYVKENFPNKNIYIVSGDEDFLQLGGVNVYFAQYKKKKTFQLTEEESYDALIKKIVNGDCSDNISSIFKGNIIKNKKELLTDINKLMTFLDNNNDIKNKFLLNQKIIDFNFIPIKYKNKFNKIIKSILY